MEASGAQVLWHDRRFRYHETTVAIAKAMGEKELVPKLNKLPADAAVLADGFSCRTRTGKLTGRRTRHLAQAAADFYGDDSADQ